MHQVLLGGVDLFMSSAQPVSFSYLFEKLCSVKFNGKIMKL